MQIYGVLLVNLLLNVIKKSLKRSWAFSNIISFCKIHFFNFTQLMNFLENPEKNWETQTNYKAQLLYFG